MAQPKLNQKALNSIPLPYPDLNEQRADVRRLNDLVSVVNALEAQRSTKLSLLAELRQSLLARAFAGELT